MERRGEVVFAAFRITQHAPDERRQQRCFHHGGQQVGPVAQFADERARQQRPELHRLAPRDSPPRTARLRRGRRGLRGRGFGRRLAHLPHQPPGLVFVPPEIRRITAHRHELSAVVFLVDHIAAQIAQGRFQNVENEFRPRGPARRATAQRRAEVLLVLGLGEVGQHLGRRAEKDHASPAVEQQGLVEHLENFRTRLVDGDHDDFVVGHGMDDFHDMLGVFRGQARGRFVEEIDVGRADHIESDIEPLALAAAEGFPLRGPDHAVAAFVQAQFGQFPVDAPVPLAAREVGRADGRGKLEVFPDGQVFVECVELRDVGDVLLERVEIFVKGEVVEEHVAAHRRELAGQGAQQTALAATARAHDTNHLAPRGGEAHAVHADAAAFEAANEVAHLEPADHIVLFLEDALGEVAAQRLARVDLDEVPVVERRLVAHGRFADEDRMVALEHLEPPDAAVKIAEDAQQHLAPRARGQQDVVLSQQGGIVRNQVGRLGVLELELTAVSPRVAAQVAEAQLGVVVEDDFLLERPFDPRPGAQTHAVQFGRNVLQCDDQDLQSEPHFERAVARAVFFQLDLVVLRHGDKDPVEREVLLRVEIKQQVLVAEHFLVHRDALARIDPREFFRPHRASLHGDRVVAEIFHDDQLAVAVGRDAVVAVQLPQLHIDPGPCPEEKHLQRRGIRLEKLGVRRRGVAVELVDDVDGLRARAHLIHERVIGRHVVLAHARPVHQVVELDTEEDFPVVAQFPFELPRRLREVGLLPQGLLEKLAQFRVDRLGIVVAQKTEARVDLLLDQLAVDARETGENLDEQRKQVRTLRDRARTAHGAAEERFAGAPRAVKITQRSLESARESDRPLFRHWHGREISRPASRPQSLCARGGLPRGAFWGLIAGSFSPL